MGQWMIVEPGARPMDVVRRYNQLLCFHAKVQIYVQQSVDDYSCC
jgi:hypothetical protein